MYRELTHYQRSADRFGKPLFSNDSSGRGSFRTTVFDNNYKGRPYGTALVAVGMLVEYAMGEDAILRGEFDWTTRQWSEPNEPLVNDGCRQYIRGERDREPANDRAKCAGTRATMIAGGLDAM